MPVPRGQPQCFAPGTPEEGEEDCYAEDASPDGPREFGSARFSSAPGATMMGQARSH